MSLVAGRAALVAARAVAARRRRARGDRRRVRGAALRPLPAGGLGLDESAPVPVVSLPAAPSRARCGPASRRGDRDGLARLRAAAANAEAGRVASFSSTGLAFDGRVKPDLVAPASGSRPPTRARTRTARRASSPSTARAPRRRPSPERRRCSRRRGRRSARPRSPGCSSAPRARCRTIRSRHRAPGSSTSVRPRPAARGGADDARVRPRAATTSFTLTNLSTATLHVDARRPPQDHGAAAVALLARARRASSCARGEASSSRLARTRRQPRGSSTGGRRRRRTRRRRDPRAVGDRLRRRRRSTCSERCRSRRPRSGASDTQPALLTIDAGRVLGASGARRDPSAGTPRRRALPRDGTRVGLLVRLRDVLPGRYTFGLTGRDPAGRVLPPGTYVVRVVATQ